MEFLRWTSGLFRRACAKRKIKAGQEALIEELEEIVNAEASRGI